MNKKGFSLLEVVIAMLILSIVTAGSFSLHVTCQKFLTDARIRLQRVEQATGVLEELSGRIAVGVDLSQSMEEILQGQGLDCEYTVENVNEIDGQAVDLKMRWDAV